MLHAAVPGMVAKAPSLNQGPLIRRDRRASSLLKQVAPFPVVPEAPSRINPPAPEGKATLPSLMRRKLRGWMASHDAHDTEATDHGGNNGSPPKDFGRVHASADAERNKNSSGVPPGKGGSQ